MAARTPMVGGNWKMNTDRASAVALARAVAGGAKGVRGVEVAVFPPFPYLRDVGEALGGSGVVLGAQDVSWAASGALTGEVSAGMLLDCGCRLVLVGHSERRHQVGEGDDVVARKLEAALGAGLGVVLCVGETLEQRTRGETDAVNERQARAALEGVTRAPMQRIVIAYEPVWAIGTGRTATPADAQAAHERLRAVVASIFDGDVAAATRIIYGGSVRPEQAPGLFSQPDIDGGLIGGASLDAEAFAAIVGSAAG